MIACRKSYVWHLLGILDISDRIYKFSMNLSFRMHILYSGLLKYVFLQKIICWASVWDFGCHRTHIQIFGESLLCNVSFLSRLMLKDAGLQKIICWTSVWYSGFLRTHFHFLGESQCNNASFLFGLLLKCDCLGKIVF